MIIKKISCIFQDYIKYEMSIRENIALGNIQNISNDELIWEKINNVYLKDKINEVQSLDINLGNWFGEFGLSGGNGKE